MSAFPGFPTFFRELWGYDPFPWQAMLAERVANGRWPKALDLPTAAGKTACVDVAIYALASQAERPLADRTAPRRIWFVVDRRIVVDETHVRAEAIARKLNEADEGPLREVAERLRYLAGTGRPLAVARLRGGILRDDGWARLPSQPAVITSTVDQTGSRLLFRGYGRSLLTAPIFAGLVANDSLVVLDEAHCSVPFLQTLRSVEAYRSPKWAESPLPMPFAFVFMSATPPPDIPEGAVFPGIEREAALNHPVLHARLNTSKPAKLVEVKTARGQADDPLTTEAVDVALSYLREGRQRVGVIVNRVRTAEDIALQMRARTDADVVLLTGRMRPFERDRLVAHWKPYVRAASPEQPCRPILLVSTQCLEVGADFSFDALISEAASLDALRQRFGRLARLGDTGEAPATLLVRDSDVEPQDPDPVYGTALSQTWRLLREKATKRPEGNGQGTHVDFGVEALAATLGRVEDQSPYLAPAADAPVLLPAYIDLFCQTSPLPHPEPDVDTFLHGKDRGTPDAQVVWRADLSLGATGTWVETVALCPPVSGEMLSVPLYRLRAWLAHRAGFDESSDIEGVPGDAGDSAGDIRPCVLWRGRDRSKVTGYALDILPAEVVVLPAAYGIAGLGQSAAAEVVGTERLDLWEPVRESAGRPVAVRLHRAVLEPWLACPPVKELLAFAEAPPWDRETLDDAIQNVLGYQSESDDVPSPPPSWWLTLLTGARNGRIETHPAGGLVLFARGSVTAGEPDMFADDDDLTSASNREVSLDKHSILVERAVAKLAMRCLPDDLIAVLRLAAYWHDVGKLDERFQVFLRQGNELAAVSAETPLAKSANIPASPARRRAIREASGLPTAFRHEILSAQLAAKHAPLPSESDLSELFLHLIASHHGHARPFAPISADPQPPAVAGHLGNIRIEISGEERANLPPPHRLDSGLAERFWRLTRRYGWWGLAYLEAIIRLGDWYGSQLIFEEEASAEVKER